MNNNQEIYHIPMFVGRSCRNNGWGWLELMFTILSGVIFLFMDLFFWFKCGLFGFCSVGGMIALIIWYLIKKIQHKKLLELGVKQ